VQGKFCRLHRTKSSARRKSGRMGDYLAAAQHSTAQHSTAQHSTAQHNTAHYAERNMTNWWWWREGGGEKRRKNMWFTQSEEFKCEPSFGRHHPQQQQQQHTHTHTHTWMSRSNKGSSTLSDGTGPDECTRATNKGHLGRLHSQPTYRKGETDRRIRPTDSQKRQKTYTERKEETDR
jgi:hypothetical protein